MKDFLKLLFALLCLLVGLSFHLALLALMVLGILHLWKAL